MEKSLKNTKKPMGLSTKIFIALIAGAISGVLIHYFMPAGYIRDSVIVEGVLYVIGQGFIRLMQMLVVPLVFCSLICGSMAIGDTKTLGKVGIKTILFYLLTTAVAVSVALSVAMLINPGIGVTIENVSTSSVTITEKQPLTQTLLNIIPKNPVESLATADMLPIIVFALFVGILLAKMGNKASTVANFFSQFNDLMMEMTMAVMKAAPIGVFCLIARTFANIGFDAFVPMLKYMGCVILALAIQCFVVYQLLLFLFTRLNPFKFLKKFFPVMNFAFTTATSNATIPLSINTLDKKLGVSKKISSFTIPLGATVNMDAVSILMSFMIMFFANACGIHVSIPLMIIILLANVLLSVGTPGVPGGAIASFAALATMAGLPAGVLGVYISINTLCDMGATCVNVIGDMACCSVLKNVIQIEEEA